MGRKLDAILGKSFKTSKCKATLNLALSRLSVLKNQRHARCSIARSDVVELLNLGHHDRALLRVEQVIKEQNMLDVFTIIEGYCHLLLERINLIEQEKVCPDELKEAASSLIYTTVRCGEFPELQEIRAIFIARYGKEFAAGAVELRNNCGVNPQIIRKLSTRMPSLENKMKVVKEIASEHNIVFQIEETLSATRVEILDSEENQQMQKSLSTPVQPEEIEGVGNFSDSVKTRKKYKDVADAAQAAFESAAYAAEAARAAVELSRSESTDPDDPSSPNLRPRKNCDTENKDGSLRMQNENGTQFSRSRSDSSLDSVDDSVKETDTSFDEKRRAQPLERKIVFDENERGSMTSNIKDEMPEGSSRNPLYSSHTFYPFGSQARPAMESRTEYSQVNFADENRAQGVEHFNIQKSMISQRTRWTHDR
ncbi:uncharacterized protein LOC111405961 isoform X2 [Olea europaea var. sylvestris]|uniref:uncharacterized protein LOC111405961 isoform X2 n=1 Tax=Olea europaea var. sylvestris TaxID=158386 RepID=UPI000C1CFC45|nr:uncharacterized protein LOC111405961 isoform X2 [Olea europaea var. sylvestris]